MKQEFMFSGRCFFQSIQIENYCQRTVIVEIIKKLVQTLTAQNNSDDDDDNYE